MRSIFFMKAAQNNVKGIPTLLEWEDVPVDRVSGQKDSTAIMTGVYPTLEIRVHRRLLFEEIGEPITKFRSRRELIQALIDAIIGDTFALFDFDFSLKLFCSSSRTTDKGQNSTP